MERYCGCGYYNELLVRNSITLHSFSIIGNYSLALKTYHKAEEVLEGLHDEELTLAISEGKEISNSKLSAG